MPFCRSRMSETPSLSGTAVHGVALAADDESSMHPAHRFYVSTGLSPLLQGLSVKGQETGLFYTCR